MLSVKLNISRNMQLSWSIFFLAFSDFYTFSLTLPELIKSYSFTYPFFQQCLFAPLPFATFCATHKDVETKDIATGFKELCV